MKTLFAIILIVGVGFIAYSYDGDELNYFVGKKVNRFEHGQCIRHKDSSKIEFVIESVSETDYRLMTYDKGELKQILKPEDYSKISYVDKFFSRSRCDFKPYALGKDLEEKKDPDHKSNQERYTKDVN